MPFASSAGQRIHYTVEGSGPLVVLLHGLLMHAGTWKACGIVDALRDGYRVACIDLLGHGRSDKPSDAGRYGQEQQSRDVIAVADALGFERAHVVGYSSGGWLAVGLARFQRQRLSSLLVGGWNLTDGLPRPGGKRLSFAAFMAYARTRAPELAEWVSADIEPGLCGAFAALDQLDGAERAVLSAGVPVGIWCGRDDSCYAPMKDFAAANSLAFLSSAGDHIDALFRPDPDSVRGIRTLIDSAA